MSSRNKYRGLSIIKTGDGVFLFYQNLADKKSAARIARIADRNHFEFSKETLHFKYFLDLKRKIKLSGTLTVSRMINSRTVLELINFHLLRRSQIGYRESLYRTKKLLKTLTE